MNGVVHSASKAVLSKAKKESPVRRVLRAAGESFFK
jgi:hypothetical protein